MMSMVNIRLMSPYRWVRLDSTSALSRESFIAVPLEMMTNQ